MSETFSRITAHLALPAEPVPAGLIDLINENIHPPTPLTADDVHIRAMYVVSDRVNSFGGCFPLEEHPRLCELLVDTPVMVGHRKDKLPVARTFHALTVERDGVHWVKSYFYWLRQADQSEDLRHNLDGGIFKECSLAFTFNFPECSLCGQDIRRCEHEPLREYENRPCHFNYRQVERVLESSLVYRGANPDTFVTRQLNADPHRRVTVLTSLTELDPATSYTVIPHYDALPVIARRQSDRLELRDPDKAALAAFDLPNHLALPNDTDLLGLLVGYRGKARCPAAQTRAFLNDAASPTTRLVLNLLPGPATPSAAVDLNPHLTIRPIPHRLVSVADLDKAAREIMTRDGVEILDCRQPRPFHCSFLYQPPQGRPPLGRPPLAVGAPNATSQPSGLAASNTISPLNRETALDNAHHLIEYLETAASQLTPDHLSLLDFDRLRQHLIAVAAFLKTQRDLTADRDLLLEDYRRRISGMLKAIAAADRTRRAPQDCLAEIDLLDTMSGAELVSHFRRIAARFRDTFPDPNHRLRYVTTPVHPRLYK